MLDVFMNYVIDDFTQELMNINLPVYFDCYLKVSDEVSNTRNALKWRKGGLYRARIGVESGSQRILDMIEKNITVEQTKASLMSLATAGVKTTAYMVVGLPGETEEDVDKTLSFLEDVKDYLYQVEPHLLRYFYTGQASSDAWAPNRKLVYPENLQDTLITQTWWPGENPDRFTAIRRLCRIVDHCRKLGISNPYTVYDKYHADMRWKNLHFKSVPSIAELNEPAFIEDKSFLEKQRIESTAEIDDAGSFLL
jgi:hypothetical protein